MSRATISYLLLLILFLSSGFLVVWQGIHFWRYRGSVPTCWLHPTSFCLPAYTADPSNPYQLTIERDLPVNSQMQQEYFLANFDGAIEQFFSINAENETQTEYLIDYVTALAAEKSLPVYLVLASFAYEMNSGRNKFKQAELFLNEIATLRDRYERRRLSCRLRYCRDMFFFFDNRSSVEKAISHYFLSRNDRITYSRLLADLNRSDQYQMVENGKYDFVHGEQLSMDMSYPRISLCQRNRFFICEKSKQKAFNYSCVGQDRIFVICNR